MLRAPKARDMIPLYSCITYFFIVKIREYSLESIWEK